MQCSIHMLRRVRFGIGSRSDVTHFQFKKPRGAWHEETNQLDRSG